MSDHRALDLAAMARRGEKAERQERHGETRTAQERSRQVAEGWFAGAVSVATGATSGRWMARLWRYHTPDHERQRIGELIVQARRRGIDRATIYAQLRRRARDMLREIAPDGGFGKSGIRLVGDVWRAFERDQGAAFRRQVIGRAEGSPHSPETWIAQVRTRLRLIDLPIGGDDV